MTTTTTRSFNSYGGVLALGPLLLLVIGGAVSCGAEDPGDSGAPGEAAALGAAGKRRGRPCASSDQCGPRQYCTVEDGVCNRPPGCRPGQVCPTVCYGTCAKRPPAGEPCGPTTCGPGLVCCNASCGICTKPDEACIQIACEPPPGKCNIDADCRTFSDYCTGCDCRALTVSQPDPVCPGPGVQCLVDPCFNKAAVCKDRKCTLVTTSPK